MLHCNKKKHFSRTTGLSYLAKKFTHEEKKANIPGGSLGPGKVLWVETCHVIRLKGHTLGLDTSHLVEKENGKRLWNPLLDRKWCVVSDFMSTAWASGWQ